MMKLWSRLYYPHWSIVTKIAAATILAAIVPLMMSAYLNVQQITAITTNGEYRRLELLASNAAQRFDRLLLARQSLAAKISSSAEIASFLAAPQTADPVLPQLTEIVAAHPDLEVILLLDRVGRCVTATMHQFIGHTYTLPPTSAMFSHLHSNVRDYPGMFVSQEVSRSARGTVLFKLRGVDIWATINQGLPPKTAGRFFLVDRQGTIISHPQLSLLYEQPFGQAAAQWQQMLTTSTTGHFSYQPSPARMPQRIGFATLATQPWILGVSQSAAEFQAAIVDLTWLNLQGVVGVGIVAVVMALSIGIYISRPIQALTSAARSLEQDESQSIDLIHQNLAEFAANADDLGQLVRAFVQMSDRVHRRDLQQQEQMQSLRVEIDRTRRDREVAEIVDSDRFQLLQQKIQQLRAHQQQDATFDRDEGADYFQQLQQRIGSLKDRIDPLA
jgi:hypothetical protein